jgi:hypothetical protein
MNIINTEAPIKIEHLKNYFEDKSTFFIIDYAESSIKADKLLTYISNLDIPCDIKFTNTDELSEMVGHYLNSSFLVSVPTLERVVISLLLQHKKIVEPVNVDMLTEYKQQLEQWTNKLESLALYNLYMVNEESFKKWVIEAHEEDATSSLIGVNFLSLLKHDEFYNFYQVMTTTPKYYSCYFNEYMFKGQNLFSFWANERNPMFLLTWGINEGKVDSAVFSNLLKESIEENNL